MPPSTYKIWPLIKFEASDAKNIAAPARSSGLPQRPAGVFDIINWSNGWRLPSGWISRNGAVWGVAM